MTYRIAILFSVQCLPLLVDNPHHIHLCFMEKRKGQEIIWLNAVEIGSIIWGRIAIFSF